MDYEVFLLSRVKEARDRTRNHHEVVATGLASTACVMMAWLVGGELRRGGPACPFGKYAADWSRSGRACVPRQPSCTGTWPRTS